MSREVVTCWKQFAIKSERKYKIDFILGAETLHWIAKNKLDFPTRSSRSPILALPRRQAFSGYWQHTTRSHQGELGGGRNLALNGYGTFMYAWNQFSPIHPTNTGKHNSGVDKSLPLSAVTYYACSVFCILINFILNL